MTNQKLFTNPTPIARKRKWDFSSSGEPFGAEKLNNYLMSGLSLLFPTGEKMFIRAVRDRIDLAANEAEKEAIRQFIAQEAQHSLAHAQYNTVLDRAGGTAAFQKLFDKLFIDAGEKLFTRIFGENFALAFTAAGEHFTATWAAEFLRANKLATVADAEVRKLLAWHIWEEIEHRHIAFDLFQKTHAPYALRVLAMAVVATYIGLLMGGSVAYFAATDPKRDIPRLTRELVRDLTNIRHFSWFWLSAKTVVSYLDPDFHPLQEDMSDVMHLQQELVAGVEAVA